MIFSNLAIDKKIKFEILKIRAKKATFCRWS